MSYRKISIMLSSAFLVFVCLAGQIKAQSGGIGGEQPVPKTRVAPAVAPPGYGVPRLGFMGQMISGYGMRVLQTNYGSPADRAGLERGDIILSINGRRLRNRFDYDDALQQAALYNSGFVSMSVRNIRFDSGLSSREFVRVSTRLMDYAVPAMGDAPVIAAYSRKGKRDASPKVAREVLVPQGKQRRATSKIDFATKAPVVRKKGARKSGKK